MLTAIAPSGSYWTSVLPGYVLFELGLGVGFVAFTICATAGAAEDQQGLASGLLNTSQQVGFALGVALLTTVAAARTDARAGPADLDSLVAGYRLAFALAFLMALAAAVAVYVLLRSPKSWAPRPSPRRAPAAR